MLTEIGREPTAAEELASKAVDATRKSEKKLLTWYSTQPPDGLILRIRGHGGDRRFNLGRSRLASPLLQEITEWATRTGFARRCSTQLGIERQHRANDHPARGSAPAWSRRLA